VQALGQRVTRLPFAGPRLRATQTQTQAQHHGGQDLDAEAADETETSFDMERCVKFLSALILAAAVSAGSVAYAQAPAAALARKRQA
jgi:hypothetical protein